MPWHTVSIVHGCATYGCQRDAKVEVRNERNEVIARHCPRHGEERVKEHNQQEGTRHDR